MIMEFRKRTEKWFLKRKRQCKEANQRGYSNEKSPQPLEQSEGFSVPLSAKDFLWKLPDTDSKYWEERYRNKVKRPTRPPEKEAVQKINRNEEYWLLSQLAASVVSMQPNIELDFLKQNSP